MNEIKQKNLCSKKEENILRNGTDGKKRGT